MTPVWQIEWMRTTPATASPPECVMTCGWRCTGAQETDGKTYTGSAYGSAGFAWPGDPFIAYGDLTEAQVLGWCWANGVDKAEVEANLQRQIDEQINPSVVQPPLPWLDELKALRA